MSESQPAYITATIAGQTFTEIVRAEIGRDLQNVAGTFELEIVDEARLSNALPYLIGLSSNDAPVAAGDPITIMIGSDTALVGWIDKPKFNWSGDRISMVVHGRDKTGDLVDCAALPSGPTEFNGVDLLYVANLVCAPFGINVTAEVDIGAPFTKLALHKHQKALTFLESAARQRAVLLVSDGVGGLLLTRGGSSRGPADLSIGDNVQNIDVEFDHTIRFSDYFVTQDSNRKRTGGPALTPATEPPEDDPSEPDQPSANSAAEDQSIGDMGHAVDPEITRWRPEVNLTRSQSGMDTVQDQADWRCRVAKGQSQRIHFDVLEYTANGTLWRPNQVVTVYEPYSGISNDLLIAGVNFIMEEKRGRITRLRLAGVTAYDRINEADRKRSPSGRGRRSTGGGASSGPLISDVP